MKRSPLKRSGSLRKRGEGRDNAILRDARAAALERDGYECKAPKGWFGSCLGDLHAHHVLPRGRGGLDHPSNLLTLCGYHHAMVHQFPAEAYELGLLQRSGDTECANPKCGHVARLHGLNGQCTAGAYGAGCPCTTFEEAA